ncbi:uncharacterized protein LOC110179911 [Drosophila serrata]|uniref:uncharacterized protein LOC110179911 n=1 Tax=Drosophila serrata TaxID=7274 RepID=UPI000A1CFBBA|nr:uncharacterized protein LOC110179911 [Drosophila serrata]XP_020803170.1 uncharacterized protein LOC110179911 [Drosophila serrata]
MRQAGFSSDRERERIYDNMLPKYQLFVRRQDFRTSTFATPVAMRYPKTFCWDCGLRAIDCCRRPDSGNGSRLYQDTGKRRCPSAANKLRTAAAPSPPASVATPAPPTIADPPLHHRYASSVYTHRTTSAPAPPAFKGSPLTTHSSVNATTPTPVMTEDQARQSQAANHYQWPEDRPLSQEMVSAEIIPWVPPPLIAQPSNSGYSPQPGSVEGSPPPAYPSGIMTELLECFGDLPRDLFEKMAREVRTRSPEFPGLSDDETGPQHEDGKELNAAHGHSSDSDVVEVYDPTREDYVPRPHGRMSPPVLMAWAFRDNESPCRHLGSPRDQASSAGPPSPSFEGIFGQDPYRVRGGPRRTPLPTPSEYAAATARRRAEELSDELGTPSVWPTEVRPPIRLGRRRSAHWVDTDSSDDERSGRSEAVGRIDGPRVHTQWVPAPPGWVTPNGTLPAPLIRRIQQRLGGNWRRALRYLEEEQGQRFRIQLNRDGRALVFLYPTRK